MNTLQMLMTNNNHKPDTLTVYKTMRLLSYKKMLVKGLLEQVLLDLVLLVLELLVPMV